MCILFMFKGIKKSRKHETPALFSVYTRFLIFHQLTITNTLRFFITETLHLVFFVFRV